MRETEVLLVTIITDCHLSKQIYNDIQLRRYICKILKKFLRASLINKKNSELVLKSPKPESLNIQV